MSIVPEEPWVSALREQDWSSMVQTDNKFLDDLAKLATGAAGTLHGVRQEVEGMVRQRLERVLDDLDLVTREEFEVVKAMAAAAREENEALKERLEALEKAAARPKRKTTSRAKSGAGAKSAKAESAKKE